MSIDTDIENIVEYLTNSVNITNKLYDIFFNPTPMDVTFEQYNDNNELIEVTIPNRAKDLKNIKVGDIAPEGQVSGDVGTLYIDSSTPQLYIKVDGTNTFGWVGIPNQDETLSLLQNFLETNDYATKEDIGDATITFTQNGVTKGTITTNQKEDVTINFESGGGGGGGDVDQTYSPDSTNAQSGRAVAQAIGGMTETDIISALGYTPYDSTNPDGYLTSVPVATSSAYGGIKYDDSSLKLNSNSQLKVEGAVEQNGQYTLKFWVGKEADYNNILVKDFYTLYIIEDTEE